MLRVQAESHIIQLFSPFVRWNDYFIDTTDRAYISYHLGLAPAIDSQRIAVGRIAVSLFGIGDTAYHLDDRRLARVGLSVFGICQSLASGLVVLQTFQTHLRIFA